MVSWLRGFGRNLPTLLLSFALALTVWISAVSEADPTKVQAYPNTIPIEIKGQDPALILTSPVPPQEAVTLSAPQSIWNRIVNEQIPIRAVVDLSGLQAGTHDVPVQIQVSIRPVQIISRNPQTIAITLEGLANRSLSVHLVQRGEVAVGFQNDTPKLDHANATVSGPESIIKRVQDIRATIDITDAQQNIDRDLELTALDAEENPLTGLTISPNHVHVQIPITQRGGFRNVVVKVAVSGRVASGYRVTNISVFPPTVTVFSTDPKLVEQLPGYVETSTLDLEGAKDDRDLFLPLNLPPGVSVVGEPDAEVQVGIAAIEGSITLTGMKVEIQGLSDKLKANISPDSVDVILSGPLPVLDQLTARDIHVVIDLGGEGPGTYQRVPRIDFQNLDLKVESILPASIEIIIETRSIMDTLITPTPTIDQQALPTATATGQSSQSHVTPVATPTPKK